MDRNNNNYNSVLTGSIKTLLAPIKTRVSDWCESNLIFPDGPSAQMPVSLFPFQRQPLDIITDNKVNKVVLMSAAQLLKTTIELNAAAYLMYHDPANMFFANSTGRELNQFKNSKFDPLIERTLLADLVTPKTDKRYPNNSSQICCKDGSFLFFGSLNAASQLRSKTIKYCFADEISNVETDGQEGDPIDLLDQRRQSFGTDSLFMLASTPKNYQDAICKQYALSDQRKYFVTHSCGHEYVLEWEQVKFEFKQIEGGKRAIADASTARLVCPHCGAVIGEAERCRMVNRGVWKPTATGQPGVVGYHISRLYSPVTTIERITQDFSDCQYSFSLKTFYNNTLALPFDDELEKDLELIPLENLRDPALSLKTIPDECLGLTVGVDVQHDRLELCFLSFNESKYWVLDHKILYAHDALKIESKCWRDLDALCRSTFRTVSGRPLDLLSVFIDSSDGNSTSTVYKFCNRNRSLYQAIKGSSSVTSPLFKTSTTAGQQLVILNVNEGKNNIRKLLNKAISEEYESPIYFGDGMSQDYMRQLSSEHVVKKGDAKRWVLKPGEKRNEALDCLNYALIAISYRLSKLPGSQPYATLRKRVAKLEEQKNKSETVDEEFGTELKPVEEPKTKSKRYIPRKINPFTRR